MNRRNFLAKGALVAAGMVLPPALNTNKVYGRSKPKHSPDPKEWSNDTITLTWVGHSTVLINFMGKWILTDPVMFERIGVHLLGFTWGPSRYTAPAVEIDDLPKPDLILLSHAHMDHMDYLSLKTLAKKYPGEIDFLTSYNTMDVVDNLPWKTLRELDWNESLEVAGINITALEVKHFGWRMPWEKDRSRGFFKEGRSYNAYLLERNGKTILFGGDTAMTDKLKTIRKDYIDIAIMPIGAYQPWRMNHCNPEEALQMAQEVNAKYFVPIHCNTFQQGREPRHEPLNWLHRAVKNYDINLALSEIGQTFSLSEVLTAEPEFLK